MSAFMARTKVMIAGEDVSDAVTSCGLRRFPEVHETVELVLLVDSLEVEPDGTLVIHILEDR